MATKCSEVHPNVAEDVERRGEPIARVTLGSERDDVDVPLVAQQMFDAFADAEHGRAVRLREIEVLSSVFISTKELRIQRSKALVLALMLRAATRTLRPGSGPCTLPSF